MTGRIDNSQTPFRPVRSLGTRPLDAVDLPETPKMAADQASFRGTQPLQPAQTEVLKPQAPPEAEIEKKDSTPWWKKVLNKAEEVMDTAKDVVKNSIDIVDAGVDEVRDSIKQGEGLAKAMHDGVHAAENKLLEVADGFLDDNLGETEMQDAGAGALDPIYANVVSRLGVGESVALQLDAGATIPLEEFGIPNASIDGSGSVTLKRIQKQDAEGKPMVDANGAPVTEIEATLELSGSAEGSYSASVGFNATAKAGSHTIGARAEAGYEAGAGVKGKVAFTFNFDPSNSEQLGQLNNLLTGHPNPFKLGKNLTALDGEGGLFAEASANASAQVGIFGDKAEKGRYNPEEIEDEEGLVNQLNLTAAELGVSAGVGGVAGQRRNYRTGERTFYLKLDTSADASANALLWGTEAGISKEAKMAVTFDKAGKLKSATLEKAVTVEQFKGMRTTVENVYGRKIDDGIIAGLEEEDTVNVTYGLNGDQIKGIMSKGAGAAQEAMKLFAEPQKLILSAQSTHVDSAEIGFDIEAVLGAEIGIRANLKASHGQETAILQE